MTKYQCTECDYVLNLESLPRRCPSCYGFRSNLRPVVRQVQVVAPVRKEIACLPTPFRDFNLFLEQRGTEYVGKSDEIYYQKHPRGGLSTVGLSIIAGRTGVGKSIFMMQVAKHFAAVGKKGVMIVTEDRALDRYLKEFENVKGITIINGYRIGHEKLLKELENHAADFAVVDSLGETVASGFGDGVIPGRGARTGSARQMEVVTDALHEFSTAHHIPIFAIHQVNRQKVTELAGSGKVEYRAQDIFLLENDDTYVGPDTRLKRLWIKKRTNFQDVKEACFLGFRGGRLEDLRPYLEMGDTVGALQGISGVALAASVSQSGLKRMKLEETKVFSTQQTLRNVNTRCVSIKALPAVSACLDQLHLNFENLYVQPAFTEDANVDLSVLAACLTLVKGPIGLQAVFMGHVDANGNIFPLVADEKISQIEIPFETVLVGNFSKLNHSVANRPNEHITHVRDLPGVIEFIRTAGIKRTAAKTDRDTSIRIL